MTFWQILPALYVAVASIPLAWIDVREHRLPNMWVLPGYIVLLIGLGGVWVSSGEFPALAVGSAIAYFAFMFLLSLIGGMGMGDVKLAGVLGGAAGLLGLTAAVLSPVVGFIAGGVISLVFMVATKAGRKARIPFGPFMLLGFWVAVALSGSFSS